MVSDKLKSKRILSYGVLHILIDSKSLLQSYQDDSKSINFLRYQYEECFNMKRTPVLTGVPEIDSIPTFENVIDLIANSGLIRYTEGHSSFQTLITNNITEIEERHQMIFDKLVITDDSWRRIWNVFVHAHLSHDTVSNIYITSDDELLKNRDHFEEHHMGYRSVNILSIEEGKEVMDVFAKNLGFCFLQTKTKDSFRNYYKMAVRLILPHYPEPTLQELISPKPTALDTLGTRFAYLLNCVDKMGINYYRGLNDDTSINSHFYFNYFIMLVTGIFDSLALYTEKKHKICIGKTRMASQITLKKSKNNKFRNKIKTPNQKLYYHIVANDTFIDLIYIFRDPIIHRDFQTLLTFHEHNGIMKDSMMEIDSDIVEHLLQLGDKKSQYDKYSEWGHVNDMIYDYLSLYIFSKKATLSLINFVDGYLEKLGFEDFFTRSFEITWIKQFQKYFEEDLSYRSRSSYKVLDENNARN